MAAEWRRYEAMGELPDVGRSRVPEADFDSPSSGVGAGARYGSEGPSANGLPLESRRHIPALIAANGGDPGSASKVSAPTPLGRVPRLPAGPTLIPFLVRGHRATVGPHGESVWEPSLPPLELIPLVEPSDVYLGLARSDVYPLRSEEEELYAAAGFPGGYSYGVNELPGREPPVVALRTLGRDVARERLASALRHRLPARRRAPVASSGPARVRGPRGPNVLP
jgi:hypothetical protein